MVFDCSDIIHIVASAAAVFTQLLNAAAEFGMACVVFNIKDEVHFTLCIFDSLHRVPNERVVRTLGMGMQLARKCVDPLATIAHGKLID